MRYQFYREHKYVSAALNDLERLIAKTDFSDSAAIFDVEESFKALKEMLEGHAHYENERLHALLKKRHSTIYQHAEEDHAHQDEQLNIIQSIIDSIREANDTSEKISLGYHLYLTYRKFVGDNLLHLHEEESTILPELQRLYTDAELRQVEAETYEQMSSEDMVHMLQILFPHMNTNDRLAILIDINILQPAKLPIAWQGIAPTLTQKEQDKFAQLLQIG